MIKISVITVCYNMSAFIEQTILSVVSQRYPNLEYIIVDGGSTDGTQAIIEKYKAHLAYYVSEPDNGMYDAIAKGFSHATGAVLAWLNADDIYLPWTFSVVNEIFSTFPDTKWIGGKHAYLDENGRLTNIFAKCSIKSQSDIRHGWCRGDVLGPLQQESMFWTKDLYDQVGGLNVSLKYAGDFSLWTQFSRFSSLAKVDLPLAAFRKRKNSLSVAGNDMYDDEINTILSHDKRYPSFLWKMCSESALLIQILRQLRFRKGIVFLYDMKSQQMKRKRVWGNCSNHTISSLLLYCKK